MQLMHVHLKYISVNCVLFQNEHKVQNQYMKEMFIRAFDQYQKKLPKIF